MPPGALIDVGGYRLHIDCEGYGVPTVIFDVGLGGTSLEWTAVRRQIRDFTRVCLYDRAGYGWSDLGPRPRTSSSIVNELFVLLDNADLGPPFILVGHSYGGYNMQLFARRYPYLTAGVVLVDSSHPSQVERFLAPPIRLNTAPSQPRGVVIFGELPPPHANLTAEAVRRLQSPQWPYRQTLAAEMLGFRDSARELREAQAQPSIPLVVVSHGRRVWPATARGALIEQLWIDMQSELAAQSPHVAHIVASESGHQIHLDQPGLVAYGIALLVDRFRAQAVDIDDDAGPRDSATHETIDFRAGRWLQDTLSLTPPGVIVSQAGAYGAP